MKKQFKIIKIKYFQNTGSAWIGIIPPEEIKTTIGVYNTLEEAESKITELLSKENYHFDYLGLHYYIRTIYTN
jgi:hypothetical protein